MKRKELFKTPEPSDYSVEDYYEERRSNISDYTMKTLYTLERHKKIFPDYCQGHIDFVDGLMECDWDFFKELLTDELHKIRIKHGFLEGNISWQKKYAMTDLFDIDTDEVLKKLAINGEYRIVVWKEGHQLGFRRYSHDEPTGVDIYLRNSTKYKERME